MLFTPQPRVLCVDDDEDSRLMLVTLLKLALIEAKAVETGSQALSLIESERFDLYLLDAWLPGIDGFELCRRMRAFDPQTPILFFSGAAHEADKQRGIEAGADDYVVKPDVDGLVGSIMRYVSQAERATAKIIPFPQMTSTHPSLLNPRPLDLFVDWSATAIRGKIETKEILKSLTLFKLLFYIPVTFRNVPHSTYGMEEMGKKPKRERHVS